MNSKEKHTNYQDEQDGEENDFVCIMMRANKKGPGIRIEHKKFYPYSW